MIDKLVRLIGLILAYISTAWRHVPPDAGAVWSFEHLRREDEQRPTSLASSAFKAFKERALLHRFFLCDHFGHA